MRVRRESNRPPGTVLAKDLHPGARPMVGDVWQELGGEPFYPPGVGGSGQVRIVGGLLHHPGWMVGASLLNASDSAILTPDNLSRWALVERPKAHVKAQLQATVAALVSPQHVEQALEEVAEEVEEEDEQWGEELEEDETEE